MHRKPPSERLLYFIDICGKKNEAFNWFDFGCISIGFKRGLNGGGWMGVGPGGYFALFSSSLMVFSASESAFCSVFTSPLRDSIISSLRSSISAVFWCDLL